MKNKNLVQHIIILSFIFLSSYFVYALKLPALVSGAIVISPIVVYLNVIKRLPLFKILISSVVFGFIFGFLFEYVMEYTLQYSVVSSVFNFKIMNILPLDNVIGHFLMAALIFTYYEFFIDTPNHTVNNKWKPITIYVIALIILNIILIMNDIILTNSYVYAIAGLFAITPLLYLIIKKPIISKKVFLVIPFFFIVWFVFEYIAVKSNWWIYPANTYIGWVHIFDINFPFEELFFWMLLYAPTLVSYYELWVDNRS